MCHVLQDIVHACCGDLLNVGGGRGGAQHYDSLLNSMANRSSCVFSSNLS